MPSEPTRISSISRTLNLYGNCMRWVVMERRSCCRERNSRSVKRPPSKLARTSSRLKLRPWRTLAIHSLEIHSLRRLLSVKNSSETVEWPPSSSLEMSATRDKSAPTSTSPIEWRTRTSAWSLPRERPSHLRSPTWAITHGRASKSSITTLLISRSTPTQMQVSFSVTVVTEKSSMSTPTLTRLIKMVFAHVTKLNVKTTLKLSSSIMKLEERTERQKQHLLLETLHLLTYIFQNLPPTTK